MLDNRQENSLLSFGLGEYNKGSQKLRGDVVLEGYKLYLKNSQGDLSHTFIPLEKVVKMIKRGGRLIFEVRPSLIERYTCQIVMNKKAASLLMDKVLDKRQLKKRLFRAEWIDTSEN